MWRPCSPSMPPPGQRPKEQAARWPAPSTGPLTSAGIPLPHWRPPGLWALSTILTSGQAPSAPEGAALLRRLVEVAGPELEILVGAGVTPENLPALAAATGARAFHLSGKRVLDSRMTFRREGVPMGLPGFSEFALWQTDAGVIRRARSALDSL